MKVLLVNGSPHKEGCTYTALCEVSKALNENGVDTDIFWIGNKALSGCIACKKCRDNNKCIFNDSVNELLDIAGDYDGFIFGSPVHWGGVLEQSHHLWTGHFMQTLMAKTTASDLNRWQRLYQQEEQEQLLRGTR